MAFALIKPFFSQETLNKFAVYGSNKKEWQAALLKEIEADQLPVHYGGTMADPDGNPLCTSKVRYINIFFVVVIYYWSVWQLHPHLIS